MQKYENELSEDHDLDYLLNSSNYSEHSKYSFAEFSSKEKINCTERQRTRQEGYDDIVKQINSTKNQYCFLQRQFEQLKNQYCRNYFSQYYQELDVLNAQNENLRSQLNKINKQKRKNMEEKSQRLSNRSSIKPRTSTNSVYGGELKTNRKRINKENSPNTLLKRKDIKLTESTSNLYHTNSSINSPKNHKRRQSQLTQRKQNQPISLNMSYIDDKCSEVNGKSCLNNEDEPQNIFVQILTNILKQEREFDDQRQRQLLDQIQNQQIRPQEQIFLINKVEDKIKNTNSKIEILSMVSTKYESEIQKANVNLTTFTQLINQLMIVKGRYIEMQKRCACLKQLRNEVLQKSAKLQNAMKQNQNQSKESKQIISLQTMLKIVTNNSNLQFNKSQSKLYYQYFNCVRQAFKFDSSEKQKRVTKMTKVRQYIDSIRDGRKKFGQLIKIYQDRITKLQEKINRIRMQNERQQKK